MTKTVSLKINGERKAVVAYSKKNTLTFQITYDPYYKKGGQPEYSIYCHGYEWGEASYSVDYSYLPFETKQTIEIVFDSGEKPSTEGSKTLLEHKKDCPFCLKSADEVEYLFERNFMATICSECVEACMRELDEKRALQRAAVDS